MKQSFGWIGTGNMGSALARAAAKTLDPADLLLSSHSGERAAALARELGCATADNETIAAQSGYLFLGVKPQKMADLLRTLSPVLAARTDEFVLVSMAAGLSMAEIQAMAGGGYPVIRIMPNTPVAVGSGLILYDATENVSPAALEGFCRGMAAAGVLDPLPERLIDAGSAVSGCGPAFADLFLEALADGGVACGLPRAKAQFYAAQMLLGAAQLALESGLHPGALKDAVCSPGGSTIAGVRALENRAFRAAGMEAVTAAYERTKEMGR